MILHRPDAPPVDLDRSAASGFLPVSSASELEDAIREEPENRFLIYSVSGLSRLDLRSVLDWMSVPGGSGGMPGRTFLPLSTMPDREPGWLAETSPEGTLESLLWAGDDTPLAGAGGGRRTNLAAAGCLLAGSAAVSILPEIVERTLQEVWEGPSDSPGSDVFHALLDRTSMLEPTPAADLCEGYFRQIRGPLGLLAASLDSMRGAVRPWPGHRGPGGPGQRHVDDGAITGDGCVMEGCCWIERGAEIGENCRLMNCVILAGATIGPGVELRNALVLPGSAVREGFASADKYPIVL